MPASISPPLRTVCEYSPEDSRALRRHDITTKAFLDLPRELLVEMLKLLDYREITRCRRVSTRHSSGNSRCSGPGRRLGRPFDPAIRISCTWHRDLMFWGSPGRAA